MALRRRRRTCLVWMRYCARVVAEDGGRFFLAVIELVDLGPLRPGIVRRRAQRRLGQDLELHQAAAAVAHRRADAVGAGVAAADDDHVLALGGDVLAVGMAAVEQALGVGVQELHGEVNALEIAALDGQIARLGGAAAQHDGVELAAQLAGRDNPCRPRSSVTNVTPSASIRSTRRCDDAACRASCWGCRT